MDSVIKAAVVYFVLWLVMRASGRRTLGQLSVFDLILFLIIGGVVARALMGQDYSLTTAFLVILTFVLIDVLLSFVERDLPSVGRIIKGVPTIVVESCSCLAAEVRLPSSTTRTNVAMRERRSIDCEVLGHNPRTICPFIN